MEKPAICYDNDGAPEVVIPDETGVLVSLGDVGGLADAMIRLAQDETLRKSLGKTGRERCLEMFDWRKMVNDIEKVYQQFT